MDAHLNDNSRFAKNDDLALLSPSYFIKTSGSSALINSFIGCECTPRQNLLQNCSDNPDYWTPTSCQNGKDHDAFATIEENFSALCAQKLRQAPNFQKSNISRSNNQCFQIQGDLSSNAEGLFAFQFLKNEPEQIKMHQTPIIENIANIEEEYSMAQQEESSIKDSCSKNEQSLPSQQNEHEKEDQVVQMTIKNRPRIQRQSKRSDIYLKTIVRGFRKITIQKFNSCTEYQKNKRKNKSKRYQYLNDRLLNFVEQILNEKQYPATPLPILMDDLAFVLGSMFYSGEMLKSFKNSEEKLQQIKQIRKVFASYSNQSLALVLKNQSFKYLFEQFLNDERTRYIKSLSLRTEQERQDYDVAFEYLNGMCSL